LGSENQEYPHLITLTIRWTSLTVVEDKSFIRATNLRFLHLSENKIERVDKNAFSGLQKLTELNLRDNKITNLPMGVFDGLQELVVLDLQLNSLSSFDFSIVKQNHQLNRLYILENAITNVTTSQQYSSNLTLISMSKNSLTSLPMENIPNLPNLTELFIDNNKLTDFDFDKFPKLETFWFRRNPFDCCFLVDMVRIMLLQMPKLEIDSEIINHMNDTEALQRQNLCGKCETPEMVRNRIYRNHKRLTNLLAENRNMAMNIGNMEATIGTLTGELQKLYIIGSTFAIGVAIIVIILVAVGIIYSHRSRKPEEAKSNDIDLEEGEFVESDYMEIN
jgi:Leucine rich repeat